ncbi:hypothetical protein AB1Y20_006625 [Prymnesium parvum]|uniref:Uncharacterized protein n=1 Tax=Prymnesium parvum TaxID=97485 RepID=A0AB34J1A8_PRYPA
MVAELSLRGFPGAGQDTLPYALSQVAHSWSVFGGPGSTAHLRGKLAKEGRKYIVATLKHFGQLRHSFINSRNPNAAPYSVLTPAAARQRFDWHMGMLQGSLTVQFIMDYYCDSVGNRDDGDADSDWEREARQSKRGTKRNGAGQNKRARKACLGDAGVSHVRILSKQGAKRWRQRRARARRSTHQS